MTALPVTTLSSALSHKSRGLKGTIPTLLALSRLFAGGGEELARTLPELAKSSQGLGREIPQLRQPAQSLAEYAESGPAEFRQMGFEFNRLFVGPDSPPAPPYESVYLSPERLVMQEQTLAVRQMYQAENLMIVSQGTAPDDFIAAELEFAAYLLNRAFAESAAGNSANALKYRDLFSSFMQEHPRRWLREFAEIVTENSRHPVFLPVMQVLLGTSELTF